MEEGKIEVIRPADDAPIFGMLSEVKYVGEPWWEGPFVCWTEIWVLGGDDERR